MRLQAKGDLEVEVVREFDGPTVLVFDIWTTPEALQQWMGVHDGWTMPECDSAGLLLRVSKQRRRWTCSLRSIWAAATRGRFRVPRRFV